MKHIFSISIHSLMVVLALASAYYIYIGNSLYYEYTRAAIFPLLTVLYFIFKKENSILLNVFFISFAISEILFIFQKSLTPIVNYTVANGLYLIGYFALVIYTLRQINIRKLIKRNWPYLIGYLGFAAYWVYYLFFLRIQVIEIIDDGFVMGYPEQMIFKYYFDIYNITIVVLLGLAFFAYLQRESLKQLYFLIATGLLFTSEMLQLNSYYINKINYIDVTFLVLSYIGYYFYYMHSITHTQNISYSFEDEIRVLREKEK